MFNDLQHEMARGILDHFRKWSAHEVGLTIKETVIPPVIGPFPSLEERYMAYFMAKIDMALCYYAHTPDQRPRWAELNNVTPEQADEGMELFGKLFPYMF